MKINLSAVRRVFLILLACSVSNIVMAQKINLDTLNFKQLNQYMVKAYKMRNAGMILTFSGVGIVAAGWISSFIWAGNFEGESGEIFITLAPFFIGMAVGIPAAIVGIPFWVIGGIKNAKAEIAIRKFDFKTNNSMAFGVGITLRF